MQVTVYAWQDKKRRCCPVSGRPIDHDPRPPAVRHFIQYSVRQLLGPYRASDFDSGTQNCDHQLVKKKAEEERRQAGWRQERGQERGQEGQEGQQGQQEDCQEASKLIITPSCTALAHITVAYIQTAVCSPCRPGVEPPLPRYIPH